MCKFKVPISPKYFFHLNNIDLLQTVKVTKSGHLLSHDRASKGHGSTPCLTSQTSLHACLQKLHTMQISL